MNQRQIGAHEARLNITWNGQNGDLPQSVPFDAADREIKSWVLEALRSDSVPGVTRSGTVNLDDFVVDRFPATSEMPYNRLFVRPKTPFGQAGTGV